MIWCTAGTGRFICKSESLEQDEDEHYSNKAPGLLFALEFTVITNLQLEALVSPCAGGSSPYVYPV